jgi:hypothetical protein
MKPLLLGTLLGGLAAFVWSNISWELIGWHEKTLSSFQNEDELAAAIAAHTPHDGTYLLPSVPPVEAKMRRGPIMFAAVRRGEFGSFGRVIFTQLLSLMAAAGLLTWMTLQTGGLSYPRRVVFLAVAGLTASVIVDIPNWNWWGFSGLYTLVNLADFTITWLLAGLVIARVARRPLN